MSLQSDQIADLLRPFVRPEVVEQHANWIFEDMTRIGFDLELSMENPPAFWRAKSLLPQPEYQLLKTRYSIDSKDPNFALCGSFVTLGNLFRLSQTVALARIWIPTRWPIQYQRQLLGEEHLDALNEIWWLKFWRNLVSVIPGPKVNPDAPDFEWALSMKTGLTERHINLEVKRRPGNINSWFKHGQPSASTSSIEHKFGPVGENAANIAAITVYQPPSKDALSHLRQWLDAQPYVHGVMLWIENSHRSEPMLSFIKPDREWVRHFILQPEPADLMVAGRPWGTLCTPDEAPDFITRNFA